MSLRFRYHDASSGQLKLVYSLEEVQKRASTPCLSVARVAAEFSILVGELRETSPRVAADMAARRQKKTVKIVQGILEFLART